MPQLNGVYTQSFNRKHSRIGLLFQGRYKSILVQNDEHLLELCRYIVLNPVRAGMVNQPKEWGWSSYKETGYACKVSKFLTVDWVLGQLANQKDVARKGYRKFVAAGVELMDESQWKKLVGQIIFGDADFISAIQSRICEAKEIGEIPEPRGLPEELPCKKIFPPEIPQNKILRNEQIKISHISYGYILEAIAEHLKIHYTTASKIAKK